MLLLKSDLPKEFFVKYTKEIVEVSMRARLNNDGIVATADEKSARNIASEILESLESVVGSSHFISVYGEVQRFIQLKKNEKKRAFAADAVRDPKAYAERKALNAQRKKFAKKMQNARHATNNGKKRKIKAIKVPNL